MARSVKVKATGPLFDGTADKAMADFADEIELELAQYTANEVQAEVKRVTQHDTGYYARNIVTERQQDDLAVTDSGVVYGPWLEGVASRNKRSRFKGYSIWRRTIQRMQDEAVPFAEKRLPKYLGRAT